MGNGDTVISTRGCFTIESSTSPQSASQIKGTTPQATAATQAALADLRSLIKDPSSITKDRLLSLGGQLAPLGLAATGVGAVALALNSACSNPELRGSAEQLANSIKELLLEAAENMGEAGAALKAKLDEIFTPEALKSPAEALQSLAKWCEDSSFSMAFSFLGITDLLQSGSDACKALSEGNYMGFAIAVAFLALAAVDVLRNTSPAGLAVSLAKKGVKELAEKGAKDLVKELATMKPQDIAGLAQKLGFNVADLEGLSVEEIGKKIAERSGTEIAEKAKQALKEHGVSKISELPSEVTAKLVEATKEQAKEHFSALFKHAELDKLAEKYTDKLLDKYPELASANNIQDDLTELYLKEMDSLRDKWFESFSESLRKGLGNEEGAALAKILKKDFDAGLKEAASPFIKEGIERSLKKDRSRKDDSGGGVRVESRKTRGAVEDFEGNGYEHYRMESEATQGGPEIKRATVEGGPSGIQTTDWVEKGREEERRSNRPPSTKAA